MDKNKSDRIRLLDIFRGFSILGILGINIWVFAYLGDLNYLFTFQNNEWWGSFDIFLRTLSLALINGKLLGVLAILFGAGLQLKYQQSLRKGRPWPGIYLWICLILLFEGFLNFTFIMEYDILMSYAVTAIIVSFIVKAGNRAIKWSIISFGCINLILYLASTLLIFVAQQTSGNISIGNMDTVVQLYQHSTWWEQVIYRLTNFWELRIEMILGFCSNVFLFLTGVLLMRKGAFAPNEKGRKIRKEMLKYGLLVGLPLNFLVFIPGGIFDLIIRYVFSPLLAIGYMGLCSWIVEKREDFRIWRWIENTGRMSLSCYLFQNLICTIIFYGWGVGLGEKMNALGILVTCLIINIAQIIFSVFWLRFAKLGPMEAARKFALRMITNER
jgi:uncharacterized protein